MILPRDRDANLTFIRKYPYPCMRWQTCRKRVKGVQELTHCVGVFVLRRKHQHLLHTELAVTCHPSAAIHTIATLASAAATHHAATIVAIASLAIHTITTLVSPAAMYDSPRMIMLVQTRAAANLRAR